MLNVWSTGRAASEMGISRQAFHQGYLSLKKIKPAVVTSDGYNYFNPKDVRALARKRNREIEKREMQS